MLIRCLFSIPDTAFQTDHSQLVLNGGHSLMKKLVRRQANTIWGTSIPFWDAPRQSLWIANVKASPNCLVLRWPFSTCGGQIWQRYENSVFVFFTGRSLLPLDFHEFGLVQDIRFSRQIRIRDSHPNAMLPCSRYC
jgi:hypothetical protein